MKKHDAKTMFKVMESIDINEDVESSKKEILESLKNFKYSYVQFGKDLDKVFTEIESVRDVEELKVAANIVAKTLRDIIETLNKASASTIQKSNKAAFSN